MLEAPTLGGRADSAGRTLTIETSLYAGACLLALAVRLVAVLGAPLAPVEAAQALPAYQLAQGGALAAGVAASPGLLSLQALGFWLFAANDAWARLPVVLLTALYPLAFWLLRPLIGRVTAIVAAVLLLVSPVWVAAGSVGLGGELSVVALLFCLGMAVQAHERGDERWLLGSGAALGLALATGAEGWQALLIVALLLAVEALTGHRRTAPAARQGRQFGIGLALSVLVFGTAALAHPGGLQGVLDQAGAWVGWLLRPQPYALATQTLLLFCYEPLLIFLALLTVALVLPASAWRRLLYIWLVPATFLTLAGGRQGGGILLLLPALAILAAEAAERIGARLGRLGGNLLLQGLGAATVLTVYGYISISGFAVQGQLAYLVLAITAVGIGGALLGLVGAHQGAASALALTALAAVLVLGVYQAGAAWQGATVRRTLPQELTYGPVADGNLMDLVTDVGRLSWSRQHNADEMPIVIEDGTGPLVGWYTRTLRNATRRESVPAETQAVAALTRSPELETLASQYVGQDYRVSDSWLPYFSSQTGLPEDLAKTLGGTGDGLQPYYSIARNFLRWLFYREAEGTTQESVTLWVLSDGAAAQ